LDVALQVVAFGYMLEITQDFGLLGVQTFNRIRSRGEALGRVSFEGGPRE
jgi:hypothetical protein